MGNCLPTTHRFFRLTRFRRVRNESPMRVDEGVEEGEAGGETRNSTGHEEIGAATNRMKQATMSEISAKEKEVEDEIESIVGTITDTHKDAESECSSTLGEFKSLESLCEEDEELEQMENSIEQNTSEKAVEDEIEIESRDYEYEYEYEDSECSSIRLATKSLPISNKKANSEFCLKI
ncbi:unnamed protein product [Rodentolepis nana]|uniref:Ovule protein n=1 Tax=Rodentolepis nana TaxID=102285 RepID=A0A0R3TGU7_RODNA|nr:unnamed protein product [Rodentolepis nana]